MPGSRSVYRKVQTVLEIASRGRQVTVDALVELVLRKEPTSFLYPTLNSETGEREPTPSRASIEKAVHLCHDIGLVDGHGKLSRNGVAALDKAKFDRVTGRAVVRYFENEGLAMKALARAITQEILGAHTPQLPTAEAIWSALADQVQATMAYPRFRTCMTLLGYCRVITASQRKVFLPFPPD